MTLQKKVKLIKTKIFRGVVNWTFTRCFYIKHYMKCGSCFGCYVTISPQSPLRDLARNMKWRRGSWCKNRSGRYQRWGRRNAKDLGRKKNTDSDTESILYVSGISLRYRIVNRRNKKAWTKNSPDNWEYEVRDRRWAWKAKEERNSVINVLVVLSLRDHFNA